MLAAISVKFHTHSYSSLSYKLLNNLFNIQYDTYPHLEYNTNRASEHNHRNQFQDTTSSIPASISHQCVEPNYRFQSTLERHKIHPKKCLSLIGSPHCDTGSRNYPNRHSPRNCRSSSRPIRSSDYHRTATTAAAAGDGDRWKLTDRRLVTLNKAPKSIEDKVRLRLL